MKSLYFPLDLIFPCPTPCSVMNGSLNCLPIITSSWVSSSRLTWVCHYSIGVLIPWWPMNAATPHQKLFGCPEHGCVCIITFRNGFCVYQWGDHGWSSLGEAKLLWPWILTLILWHQSHACRSSSECGKWRCLCCCYDPEHLCFLQVLSCYSSLVCCLVVV